MSVFTSGRVSGKVTCVLITRIVPWHGSSVIPASGAWNPGWHVNLTPVRRTVQGNNMAGFKSPNRQTREAFSLNWHGLHGLSHCYPRSKPTNEHLSIQFYNFHNCNTNIDVILHTFYTIIIHMSNCQEWRAFW
jgi:hypothetical protein